jgi:putative flavoprotein involved in K+ transport
MKPQGAGRRWCAGTTDPNASLSPRHLFFANGVSGLPRIPVAAGTGRVRRRCGPFPQLHGWFSLARQEGAGTRHRQQRPRHRPGAAQQRRRHDHHQRGSTTVVTVDPSAKLNYALYDEAPLEDCDLLASANTYPLVVRGYQLAVERMVEFDKEMIAGLIARGFKYDIGEDKTGHQMKYRRRGGGYYLDVGCSGLIISGKIRLLQFDQIERFVPKARAEGWLDSTGGSPGARHRLLHPAGPGARLLGEAIAERVGQIWGFGPDGEMANMWKRTPQEGLWFIAGGLGQCRIYSKYLALQIKAIEEGLLPRR